MGIFANQEKAERVDRDGKSRTHVEETRTVVSGTPAASVAPNDRVDQQIVDHRSVRSMDFSAATVNGLLGILLLAIEAVIATRFLLIAFGANRTSGFVNFMLNLSWPFVRPFSNAFATHTWDQGIVEPASLLAMGVFAIVFALAMMLINSVVPDYRARHDVASSRTTRL
jgi:hypothetical protein